MLILDNDHQFCFETGKYIKVLMLIETTKKLTTLKQLPSETEVYSLISVYRLSRERPFASTVVTYEHSAFFPLNDKENTVARLLQK